jgi:hypothetical protein
MEAIKVTKLYHLENWEKPFGTWKLIEITSSKTQLHGLPCTHAKHGWVLKKPLIIVISIISYQVGG